MSDEYRPYIEFTLPTENEDEEEKIQVDCFHAIDIICEMVKQMSKSEKEFLVLKLGDIL